MEGQIRHGLLYSGGSGPSGRLIGAVFGRHLLAKLLLKEGAPFRKLDPRNRDFWFSSNSPQTLTHSNRTAILCQGVRSV